MIVFKFTRLHIPSGEQTVASTEALDRLAALRLLNAWNRSMPGVWAYWSDDPQL